MSPFALTGNYPCYAFNTNQSDFLLPIPAFFPLRIVCRFSTSGKQQDLPSSYKISIDSIPRTQTPKERAVSCLIELALVAFQFMNTVGLSDMEIYGAQYLHLRCGLASPFLQLHRFCYLHLCALGSGLLARLCLGRILSTRVYRFSLAHS